MADDHYIDALPPGYRLREYEILRVLGAGGFGITYLAQDTQLDRAVAIKECLPRDYAVRTEDHSVRPRSSAASDDYAWALNRFLDEARTLARLDHPSIAHIHTCFEANGTGYMVMEYIKGKTLDDHLQQDKIVIDSILTRILDSLVEGLEEVHRMGFLHRDVTPKNVILKGYDTPVLIDFGSARQMVGARSRSLTAVATPGYAPLEQYSSHGKQGPWTDIYGLSAVAYQCITGTVPLDAMERVQGDDLVPASEAGLGRYSEGLLAVVDLGMSLKSTERPQDLKEWRATRAKSSAEAVQRYRLAAEQGDVDAQFRLGTMYLLARDVSFGCAEAVKWHRMAADKGHAEAQSKLGRFYYHGTGVPKDKEKAVEMWRLAAEQGHIWSHYFLHAAYSHGDGVPQDDSEAAKWARRAAEHGDAKGQTILAGRYAEGQGVPKDYVEAVKWYKLAAEQGHAEAQDALGYRLAVGQGIAKDDVEAAKWYRLAAEQGTAHAQYALGLRYAEGRGVTHDDVEAIKWYRLAANQGTAYAQYALGFMYAKGRGIPSDDDQALKWYRLAAENGNANALVRLGSIYFGKNQTTPRDYSEMAEWFRREATQGNATAQNLLGLVYDHGIGVPQDNTEAAKWYRLAAEQGHSKAQLKLCQIYMKGRGVPRDNAQARKWSDLFVASVRRDRTLQ